MQREKGFSYLLALFLVAILTIISVRAMKNIATSERRLKEEELLYVGQAYRNAIRDYYENSPGTAKVFPLNLKDLLLDERATKIRRPLRRLYLDPITNSAEWGLLMNNEGGIVGVYSQSELMPFKVDGFPIELMNFKGAKHYKNWQFVYQPN